MKAKETRPGMTVTVNLPPELEESVVAQARTRGVTVAEYIQQCLGSVSRGFRHPVDLTDDEFNRGLDEIADFIEPSVPPLTDEAMSRDSIYER